MVDLIVKSKIKEAASGLNVAGDVADALNKKVARLLAEGAERAKAIAKGQDEFEVGGKKFKVTNVDKEDKENAKEFANEAYVKSMGFKAVSERIDGLTKSLDPNGILCKKISQRADIVKPECKQMKKRIDEIEQIWGEVEYTIETSNESVVNEGKHDAILDKLADIVKGAKSFMDIGKELKSNGIKYSFGTNMIPMYIIDKPVKIAILNNKYADGAERVVGDTAIGLMESIKEEKSMKLTDILSENKYSIIDPKGNQKGVGPKDAANKMQKKLGGSKKGYFVVPAKSALKARRAMEKYKFDFKNPKLQDMMSDLYFEGVEESVNEGASSEEKRIVMLAVRKIAKYRNVPIDQSVVDVIRAAEELDRDIQKGKVKK